MKELLITINVVLILALVGIIYGLTKDVNKKTTLPQKKVIWLFLGMGIVLLLLSISQYYLNFHIFTPAKEWKEGYSAYIGCLLLSIASFVFAILLRFRKIKR